MRKDTRQGLALMLAFLVPLAPCVQLHAATYADTANEFVVANTAYDEYMPKVWGSNVTWGCNVPPYNRSDVFYRTLPDGPPTNITNDPLYGEYPDIYGDIIVYNYHDGGGVRSYTIGGSSSIISDHGGGTPSISGDLVVWFDSYDIYGKYLSGGPEFPVCSNGSSWWPVVDGDIVVWRDIRNQGVTGSDIYAKDVYTGEEIAVCTAPGTQDRPDVSGNIIVWQDHRNGSSDIYGYNLDTETEFPIAVGPSNQEDPAVCGNYVVWTEGQNIQGYDILSKSTFYITITSPCIWQPDISGNIVVWRDYRDPEASDIYGNIILSGEVLQAKQLGADRTGAMASDPVNTSTGNFYLHTTDLTISGPGVDFDFIRSYNAQDSSSGPFGTGWTHSYDAFTAADPCSEMMIVKWGDGQGHYYLPDFNVPNSYHPAIGAVYDKLKKNPDSSWTVTQKDQTRCEFDLNGKLTSIIDKNGNTVSLAYDGNSHLDQITDSAGRVIDVVCDSGGLLQSITDPNSRQISYGYTSGKLTSVTDARGNTTYYTYDPGNGMLKTITNNRGIVDVNNIYDVNDRVIQQINGRGKVSSFSYNDPCDNHTTVTDPLGRQTIHGYDGFYRLTSITDPCNNIISYTYDIKCNRTSITDKNGYTRYFTYDDMGNVLTMTDPNDLNDPNTGAVTTVTYDANNNPLTKTDANGTSLQRVWTYEYDPNGNLIRTVNSNGSESLRSYTTKGLLASETDENGNKTLYTYDSQGNLTDVNDALGNISHYSYDEIGRRIAETDARSNTTNYSYNKNDNLLTETDPNGKTVSHSYDENNNKTAMTDKRGNSWSYEYNENDILTREVDANSFETLYGYDDVDNRISVTDKRGKSTYYSYDSLNRLIDVNDPLGHHTSYTYDAKGNRISQTNALGKSWNYEYDALDRLIKETNPVDSNTTYEYDLLGREIAITNARGSTTQYDYDVLDRLIQVTDAMGGITEYEYDPVGNLLSIIDANEKASSREYDALNRLICESDPLGNTTEYQYDEVGNRIARVDAMSRTTSYEYDELNRLTDVNYPNGKQVSYSYDENGNRIAMTDWNSTASFEYDKLNRITASIDAFNNRVEYEYDGQGNRTKVVYPDSNSVSYNYDDAGRLESVSDWNNRTTTYTYDAADNLKSVTLPNSSLQLYDYDNASRLISVQNKDKDSNSVGSFYYTLDEVGNRIDINEVGTLSPLITFSDANYTYDDADRLVTGGSCSYAFNDNGDQTVRNAGGLLTNYSYDPEDRLVGVSESGLAVEHIYDGLGNRIARVINSTEKRYVLDLASPMSQALCETDDSNNITAYYIFGAGLLAKITPDGNEIYYHYDGLGSTVALTDGLGNLTDRYAYMPFGQLTNSQGSTDNPFKYVGRFGVATEPDGTLFMRARFYDPLTGRFLSTDPVEGSFDNPLSLHDYLYALANPLTNIDPQGTMMLMFVTIPDIVLPYVDFTAHLIAQLHFRFLEDLFPRFDSLIHSLPVTPITSPSKPSPLANVDVHATIPYQPPEDLKVNLGTKTITTVAQTKAGAARTETMGAMKLVTSEPDTVKQKPRIVQTRPKHRNVPVIPSVDPKTYMRTHTSTTRKY